jgi:hypothetical protein
MYYLGSTGLLAGHADCNWANDVHRNLFSPVPKKPKVQLSDAWPDSRGFQKHYSNGH